MALSPAQAVQRAKQQGELAAEVIERFTKDAAIERRCKSCGKPTGAGGANCQIVRLAMMLDFAATSDFDAARFAALLDLLPADLASQSHDWVNWFFGQKVKGRTPSA